MQHREPAVAGTFYPASAKELETVVAKMLGAAQTAKINTVTAIMVPHAGYIYSGSACAKTMSCTEIPENVILIGPNHHGLGPAIAISQQKWVIPTGTIPTNHTLTTAINEHVAAAEYNEEAHRHEHSLEVQLPFLYHLQPALNIAAVSVSQLSLQNCFSVADGLKKVIAAYGKRVLLLASSDMNHYESREIATKKDKLALAMIERLDPAGLYHTVYENSITMCGFIPMVIVMQTAILLGANRAKNLVYTDSGHVSGDTRKVVAYAGSAIFKK